MFVNLESILTCPEARHMQLVDFTIGFWAKTAKTPAVLRRLKYPRFVFKVTQPLLAQSARSFINEKNNPNATFFKLYMSADKPPYTLFLNGLRLEFFYLRHVGLILWDWILPNIMLMHWPPKNFRNWPWLGNCGLFSKNAPNYGFPPQFEFYMVSLGHPLPNVFLSKNMLGKAQPMPSIVSFVNYIT